MNQPGFWTLHKTNKLAANKPIVFFYIYSNQVESDLAFLTRLWWPKEGSKWPYISEVTDSRIPWITHHVDHHVQSANAFQVGGRPTPLKNIKVSWDYYSQYMENKKCSKPPASKLILGNVFFMWLTANIIGSKSETCLWGPLRWNPHTSVCGFPQPREWQFMLERQHNNCFKSLR